MVDPRAEEGKHRCVGDIFFFSPESKEVLKHHWCLLEGPWSQLEGAPASQIWDNSSINKNNLPCFFKRNHIVQSQLIRSLSFFSFLSFFFLFTEEHKLTNVKEKTELESHLFVIPSVIVNSTTNGCQNHETKGWGTQDIHLPWYVSRVLAGCL